MLRSLKIIIVLALMISGIAVMGESEGDSVRQFPIVNYKMKADRNTTPSVDHSKFEILKQDYETVHDVTAACLSCHTNRDKEVMATSHWLWQREEEIPGKGKVWLGKRNILNNFCIGTKSNEATCTRCHIGYGFGNQDFDFTEPLNIDCLVCHDKTDTYRKEKGAAGYPKKTVNLNYVSQNVGEPGRENCGICHFWGGGGNNVKHGDLEISLLDCKRSVDVHMTTEGEDMSCVDCHVTEKHEMSGKLYALSSENKNRASCEHCHTDAPHKNNTLNTHGIRVACQTCHIPTYAKVNSTKMIWDWSTAGRLDEHGKPMHESDADGNHNYLSIKGNFVFDDNVIPEYYWFNGIAGHQLIEDKIDTIPVQMNTLYGSYRDKGSSGDGGVSKIWPVKVHRGRQPYDTVYKTLIQAKTWDKEAGKGAYWTDFDWQVANKLGMDYVGLPYSGHFDFVETEMYWPLNHMVSPAEQSLKCADCHTRDNGRLANLTDFYLSGRDVNMVVETAGVSFILASLIFVLFHAGCRIIFGGKCKVTNINDEKEF